MRKNIKVQDETHRKLKDLQAYFRLAASKEYKMEDLVEEILSEGIKVRMGDFSKATV